LAHRSFIEVAPRLGIETFANACIHEDVSHDLNPGWLVYTQLIEQQWTMIQLLFPCTITFQYGSKLPKEIAAPSHISDRLGDHYSGSPRRQRARHREDSSVWPSASILMPPRASQSTNAFTCVRRMGAPDDQVRRN